VTLTIPATSGELRGETGAIAPVSIQHSQS
jgi:hypothetical protein